MLPTAFLPTSSTAPNDMPAGISLGYLVFSVRRRDRWDRFCSTMLGLPAPVDNADGSRGWRIDDARQRLIVTDGADDDLAALGLDCGDDAVLDALLDRLGADGVACTEEPAATRTARGVRRLHALHDPAGNRIELFVDMERAAMPFASEAFPGGFRTGALGLGHVVLVSKDLAAMESFYVDQLGFAVSERLHTRAGPITVNGTFLHCNPRHHSLALFDLPLAKRIHHFMIQANEIRDVGVAFDRARREKVPLSLDLGQHPDPDGTFSFYGATPSGFDFEIGAGGREIEPADWEALRATVTSSWGHRPQLRLQLKMAGALIASKLRPASVARPRRALAAQAR